MSSGKVIESGRDVAGETWNVVMQVDCNSYHGCGYLTVPSTPHDLPESQPQSEQEPVVDTQDAKGKGREGT